MDDFLLEADDALLLVHLDDAEAVGVGDGHLDRREGHGGAPVLVGAQHLAVVHLVDVVARQDDDVARALPLDGVQVLVDRVGGAQIPVFADPLLGRKELDELVELLRHDVPAHPDVTVQRERLVLGRDEDPPQPRVDAIAEREVDDPIGPAEVDRRLGAILGERIEPLAGAAGEDDDEGVFHTRCRKQPWGPARLHGRVSV